MAMRDGEGVVWICWANDGKKFGWKAHVCSNKGKILLEKCNLATKISDQKFLVSVSDRISDYTANVAIRDWICDWNWSWCLTWVSDWINDRNERSLKTSVAISVAEYVKKQNYFSHRSSDRYVIEDNNRRCFGRLMKIIATEINSIVMRISVLRLVTELATKISLFYISEVKKYCIYYKYIIYLNIFYTRKILKLVY